MCIYEIQYIFILITDLKKKDEAKSALFKGFSDENFKKRKASVYISWILIDRRKILFESVEHIAK